MGLFGLLINYLVKFFRSAAKSAEENRANENEIDTSLNSQQGNNSKKKNPQQTNKDKQENGTRKNSTGGNKEKHHHHTNQNYTHPWLVANLKGHSGRVLDVDFSANGKYLATCSEDGTVLIWPTKYFQQNNKLPIRGNIAYDKADKVKWSPDSKAFVVHKSVGDDIEVYKLNKKVEDGGGYTVTSANRSFKIDHSGGSDTVAIDMSCTGKFIMSCSAKTDVVLYDLNGAILSKLDTVLGKNHWAKISPDGKLLASSGFTPDVKVWAVNFSRGSGEFESVKRAFELTGHTAGVYHFDFNGDSTKIATVSKDGTWKMYNIGNIDYTRGQDPELLVTGNIGAANVNQNSRIAMSPNSTVIAISSNKDIILYSAIPSDGGKKITEISNVHTDVITGILFDSEGKWLITSGDKHVRVFWNVPGYQMSLQDLTENKLKAKTEGMKQRIQEQIESIEEILKAI